MNPVNYNNLSPKEKRKVREEYIKAQNGDCHYCGDSLSGQPNLEVRLKPVTASLFPDGFFKHPVHLHHSHETGLTIGAVHCYCNAVLWEYEGE